MPRKFETLLAIATLATSFNQSPMASAAEHGPDLNMSQQKLEKQIQLTRKGLSVKPKTSTAKPHAHLPTVEQLNLEPRVEAQPKKIKTLTAEQQFQKQCSKARVVFNEATGTGTAYAQNETVLVIPAVFGKNNITAQGIYTVRNLLKNGAYAGTNIQSGESFEIKSNFAAILIDQNNKENVVFTSNNANQTSGFVKTPNFSGTKREDATIATFYNQLTPGSKVCIARSVLPQ